MNTDELIYYATIEAMSQYISTTSLVDKHRLPTTMKLQLAPTQPELTTPTLRAQRRIAIAVDLSDESAFTVKWAIKNYLRPGDTVILLHVRPTSILYGADWGGTAPEPTTLEHKQQLEDSFDNLTSMKAAELAQPLVEANVPYKVHIVKDHDLKERLCLEVERLGLSAVIMGSRGFGGAKKGVKGRLGSVSDYCVQHCVCPVIVVRYSDGDDGDGNGAAFSGGKAAKVMAEEVQLHPVPEEDLDDDEKENYDDDHKSVGA